MNKKTAANFEAGNLVKTKKRILYLPNGESNPGLPRLFLFR
jgi:hypothetical protein